MNSWIVGSIYEVDSYYENEVIVSDLENTILVNDLDWVSVKEDYLKVLSIEKEVQETIYENYPDDKVGKSIRVVPDTKGIVIAPN